MKETELEKLLMLSKLQRHFCLLLIYVTIQYITIAECQRQGVWKLPKIVCICVWGGEVCVYHPSNYIVFFWLLLLLFVCFVGFLVFFF